MAADKVKSRTDDGPNPGQEQGLGISQHSGRPTLDVEHVLCDLALGINAHGSPPLAFSQLRALIRGQEPRRDIRKPSRAGER